MLSEYPCYCEHEIHAPEKWCSNSAIDGAYADFVGNVCRECARTHYRSFIVWPTTLIGRDVCTITGEDVLGMVLEMAPSAPFIQVGGEHGHLQYRVALTFEEEGAVRALDTNSEESE